MLLEGLVQRITDLETQLAVVTARLDELSAKSAPSAASTPTSPPPAAARSASATTTSATGKATAK